MSDDSNPKIEQQETGCCCFLFSYVTTAQAISDIRIPSHLSAVWSVSPCFCLHHTVIFAAGFVLFCRGGSRLYWPTKRSSIHLRKQVCDFPPEWFRGTGFFTILPARRLDSKWSDWQDSAQRVLTLPLFFFPLTLKPVTNPQRGNNKLWKTTYRASSSCGNEVPWTPTICLTTICVEFLKPDKGCNFVYRESIHN